MVKRLRDIKPKDTELAVEDFLKESGITWSTRLVVKSFNQENWECDKWCILVEKGNLSFSFDYYTGIGHRVISDLDYKNILSQYKGSRVLAKKLEFYAKPAAPHITGLIYSLLIESQACEQSFAYWCSDFGYDTDSRKAFSIYEESQKNGDKLRRLFSRKDIERLQELLQDY